MVIDKSPWHTNRAALGRYPSRRLHAISSKSLELEHSRALELFLHF